MKRMLALGAALALASSIAGAQGPGYGQGGYGGYGPGMMGGGPGMMGGGYGPGMGGYGGGYGRGFGGAFAALNLSDGQHEKIFAIQEQHRRKNVDTMSKVRTETFKLRRMYNAESVDSKALVEQQTKVDELRRQMLASRLETHKSIQSVLTPEQRKQVRQFGPWWAREEADE